MKSVRKVNDKMKEEARNKKVPPKKSNDEILSALYRHNNFDSIKDESLDIDISACVTINADGLINGSSLSSSDFWRVLDESARNSELDDVLMSNHDSSSLREFCQDRDATNSCSSMKSLTNGLGKIKNDQPNSFSGTFVRPEPPSSLLFSPIKKAVVKSPPDFRQFKIKDQIGSQFDSKTTKTADAVKEEPIDQEAAAAKLVIKSKAISTSSTSSEPIQCTRSATSVSTTTTTTTVGAQNQESTVYIAPTTRFKCLDCNSIFLKDRQDYVTHHLAKHRIKFVCSECNREFEQEVGLKKHIKSHRPTDGRKDTWKICPECGKCLKHGSMWMHRKIHSENKQYGCDICGQKFVQKINLTHHSRMHTAEKPYECPECQKRFQERSHLQRHQKYHAQIRSFRCDKCGKMYKTERCLKVHNLVHLEQRPFACKVCDKSFISNSKLKQHSNIHTGERPFKCNYCPRDFTNFPNWLKHTRRRHKVDHKTGEHLENIPSYCSKKSTKTVKPATKPAAPPKIAPKPNETNKETATKPQTKRTNNKRIQPAGDKQVDEKNFTDSPQNTNQKSEVVEQNIGSLTQKSKRERKQLTPKQVQEAPAEDKVTEVPPTTNNIKREIVDNCGFPDLHTLSITSAEEFIMEQALQMEECGLYESPVVDTDNAISAETAAEMHFKIKREISANEIKREENFLLNGANQRLICSSLESSPFSSPASIELSSTKLPLTCVPFQSEITNSNLFFLPSSVTVSNSNGVPIKLPSDMENTSSISHVNIDSTLLPQLPSMQFEDAQLPSDHASTQSNQLLLNQLYLPMTVSMPFMMQSNQMLPSVNTLLFTTSNSPNYMYGNNDDSTTTTTVAQQNLTSSKNFV